VFTDEFDNEFNVDHGAVLDHHFDNRCGEDWPCYCNTLLINQIECPYCAVPQGGGDDSFLCGADNDVLDIPQDDGTAYACQCQVKDAFTQPSIVCGNFPTSAPKSKCVVDLPNGQQLEVEEGEPVTTTVSPCGEDFPYTCNPDLPDDLEFPYCQVKTQGGGTACAKGGANVVFTNMQGNEETCDCLYLNDKLGPQTTCKVTTTPEPTLTPSPTPSPKPTPAPIVVVRDTSGVMKRSSGSSTAVVLGVLAVVWEIMEM
jgi:hypothetical protein